MTAARAIVGTVVLFGATALAVSLVQDVKAVGPHIDLYFMTAANSTGAPAKWCTGIYDPPIHGSDRAIDVFGDGSGSVCTGDNSSNSLLRALGFGGSSNHHTMSAWASGGQVVGGCDIILIGMIDVMGGLHGQLRYLHSTRTVPSDFAMQLFAAPGSGATRSFVLGSTTSDDGCDWEGYHVHQGTLLSCMTVNAALLPTTQYTIWNPYFFVSEIDYAEGLSGCDR